MHQVFIVANFEMRQNVIASTLCVKKDIPANSCQGKCQLRKQLEKSSDQNNRTTDNENEPRGDRIYAILVNKFLPESVFNCVTQWDSDAYKNLPSFYSPPDIPPRL